MSYVSTLSYDAASSDTATVTGWTSVTDGQFALALVARGSVEAQPTSAPSGWTEIDSYTRAGNGPKYAGIFWKIKQAGDSNPAWEWAATDSTKVQIAIYDDDVNETSPIADFSNVAYEVSNTIIQAAAVTTAGDDTRVIFAGTLAGTSSATFSMQTAGFVEEVDTTSSSLMSVVVASRTYPTIVSTGSIYAYMSTGGNDKHAFAVALAVDPTVVGTGSMTMSGGSVVATPTQYRRVVASGNYSSTATWAGGVKPSTGEKIFNDGYTLTFDENTPVIGSAAANDDYAIVGSGAAQFIVNAGITVQCNGTWLSGGNGSSITVNNNSVVDMQSDYNNNLALGGGVYNIGTFSSNATVGNWAIVKSTGTTKTEFRCISDEDYYNEALSGSYVKLQSIGSVRCQYSCDIDHWIIDCESFTSYVSQAEDRNYIVDNCTFTNASASIANPSDTATTGGRSFTGNVVLGSFSPSTGHAYDYEDCYFGGSFQAGTGYKGTFTRCVFTTGLALNNFETTLVKGCLFFAPNTASNPHYCNASGIDPVIEECIFECFSSDDNGDCILLTGSASASVLTARYNIVLPNAAGDSSGTLITGAGDANESVDIYNNTYIGLANFGETYIGHVGQVRNCYNNMLYGASSKHLAFQGGSAVDDIVQNAGYGSAYGATDPWQYTTYSAKYQSDPTGNDLNDDPSFSDETRDFASWAVDILGSTGLTEDDQRSDATAALLAINETDNPDYNASATPLNFAEYIRIGLTPENGDYATAGIGGAYPSYIGALLAQEYNYLGTGSMSMSGGGIGSEIGRVAQIGTGTMDMSGGSIRSLEYYTATLGTGTMVQGASGINELFRFNSDLGIGSMIMSSGQLITVDRSFLSYNQGRAYASAAELMRGCVWADNFVSSYRTKQIGGAIVGSPTYTNSVTLDGLSYVTYNQQALTDTFSAVVRFSASAASSGVLFGTQDPISASLQGWRIYVDATGVRANHSDGSTLGVECTIDLDYADGVEHVVTYVVDLISGDHTLYLDDDSDTQSTAATGTIGAGKLLSIGGLGFAGTIQRARLFESEISSGEHSIFYADSLSGLLDNSIGVYRCDSVSDQTDHIWTKTLNLNDLTKGDGSSSGYPTQTGNHYVFDGVDDYVSGWPTQPTLHTDSIAKTTSYPSGIPVIQQVNDDTVKTLLTTSGSYTGNLHSLVLSTGELTTLEKNHLEWSQLKKLWRQTHVNPFVAHLINQEIAVLVCHFDNYGDPYIVDYSNTSATILPSLITWLDGLLFTDTNSVLTVDDDTDLRSDSVTVHINGDYDFTGSGTDTLFEKGLNYYLSATYTGGNVTFSFNGQAFSAVDGSNIYSVAVSCVDGAEPRLYVNGDFIETASGTVIVDDTDTDDLLVGNTSGGGEPLSGTTKEIDVFNSVLTDAEIRLLHNYSFGVDTASSYTFPSDLLKDGDMESVGVTDWIAATGGVLTKTIENRPNAFGVRTLCIECIATDSVGAAAQIVLTSGLNYRITGWARTDGVNASAWIGNVSASDIAYITAGTSWTYFDEVFTAAGTLIYLSCFGSVATSDMVWFDDVLIEVI